MEKLSKKDKIINYILPRRKRNIYSSSHDVGGILHIAMEFNQADVIKLLLTICECLPENYDVLYCGSHTTTQDLKLFTDRCCAFGNKRQFYFLEVNKLLYEQQEVCMDEIMLLLLLLLFFFKSQLHT